MILMLDNYDSFTYNVVQYLAELGADVRVVRNDQGTVAEILRMKPAGVVLSPGPGRPENAGIMNELIRSAEDSIPILGVCLGLQAIAQVHGARIGYAPTLMHGKVSQIEHDGSRLFTAVPSPFPATRYHSLIVERMTLGPEFAITAWTSDQIVMGSAHRSRPLFGVQFHPESIGSPVGPRIVENFLRLQK
jgi:anthranilate synthase component II